MMARSATGIFNDGSTREVTLSAVWSSSNPKVAVTLNDPALRGLASAIHDGDQQDRDPAS